MKTFFENSINVYYAMLLVQINCRFINIPFLRLGWGRAKKYSPPLVWWRGVRSFISAPILSRLPRFKSAGTSQVDGCTRKSNVLASKFIQSNTSSAEYMISNTKVGVCVFENIGFHNYDPKYPKICKIYKEKNERDECAQ